MECPRQPRSSAAAAVAAAAAALLLATPTLADMAFAEMVSVAGQTPRAPRPNRPTRRARAQRPARPGRPGRPAPPPRDVAAPPPQPSEPAIEPPAGVDAEAPPTDAPGEEGDLRLISRVDINGFATGSLQVFQDGAFGAVCDSGFDTVAADVACRQLGFVGGTNIPIALDGGLSTEEQRDIIQGILAPMALGNLACTGTEERLVDCPGNRVDDYTPDPDYTYTYSAFSDGGCDPLQPTYAFVACGTLSGPATGDLRLVGGETSADGGSQFGRLEVFNAGGWGTVCDRSGDGFGRQRNLANFTPASVDVACQQLGFIDGAKTEIARASVLLEERRIPTWLAGASCGGSEDTLTDCPGVSLRNNTEACGLDNILSITCSSGADPGNDGRLRLMDGASGPGYEYGRLEILLRGFWSTVCDVDGFTPDSAQVACKVLGFDGGAALEFRQAHTSSNNNNEVLAASIPVGLASVDCDGTETSLLDCSSSEEDLRQCGIDNTNLTKATVLACGTTSPSCDKTPAPNANNVRLRGGFGTPCDAVHSGFVEIFHRGEWGAICNPRSSESDKLAADVVCRQLGFPHGTVVDPTTISPDVMRIEDDEGDYTSSPYIPEEEEASESQERFWLAGVSCFGTEDKLVDCDLGVGFRTANSGCQGNRFRLTVACRTFPVAEALESVTTPGAEEGDVRLVDQTSVANWQVGRLEVFFEGSWSQVCARAFDSDDADVACRQLGFGAGSVGPNRANGAPPAEDRLVYPEVAVTAPGCNGSEANLLACPNDMVGLSEPRDCFSDDGPGLILACVAEAEKGEEGALRLTDDGDGGTAAGTGVLEIFHAGAWGTICEGETPRQDYDYNTPLTDSSAVIACQELGFRDGAFRDISSIPANITLRPAWLGQLQCIGTEASLSDCGGLEFGNTETCGFTQRLVCSSTSGPAPSANQGDARLVGGRADPGGAWAYGRLEVFDNGLFSSIRDRRFGENFGRRGAQVACRSLGFTSGAQILSGEFSALPGPSGEADTINRVACQGDEATLVDCEFPNDYFSDYTQYDEESAIAIVCSTGSGCAADTSPPAQGDVRLVPLTSITSNTAPCDAVHFGGVEIFNDGRWGRICNGRSGSNDEDFTLTAQVVCRQLGFPFGSLYDVSEVNNSTGDVIGSDYEDYSEPGEIVFATEVVCTGMEARLDECFLPEDFGDAPRSNNDFGPEVETGVRRASCRRQDGQILGVVCRQFEIEESDVIRRR